MTELTYTLTVSQSGKHAFCVDVPEIDFVSHEQCNLDTALMMAARAIEHHRSQRVLVIVVNPEDYELPEFADAPPGLLVSVDRIERHIIYNLMCPLTREQARWLDANEGKLFKRYYTLDQIALDLQQLIQEAMG